MRRLVIAFTLGVTAAAMVEVIALLAVAVAADEYGWTSFTLGGGPLLLLEVERTREASSATFGGGVPVLAFAVGILNAGGAALVARRN
jgi:hypothetical protein